MSTDHVDARPMLASALVTGIDHVGIAQSGYVEIMKRQQQGWTYLRP